MVKDKLRQGANVVFAVAQVVLSGLAGAGLLGGRTTGEIADDYPTYVGPAGYAFAIWGLIFLSCLAYAAYQASPDRRENPMLRKIGWWTASAFAGNSLWLLAFHAERFLLAGALIFWILLSLTRAFVGIVRFGRRSISGEERWLVEAPIGVFFGWIAAASVVNAAQVLVAYGFDGWGFLTETQWSVALLLVGALFACATTAASGSVAYASAVVWALAAIAAEQLKDSAAVASTAGALAVLIVVLLAATRTVRGRKERRAAKRPQAEPMSP